MLMFKIIRNQKVECLVIFLFISYLCVVLFLTKSIMNDHDSKNLLLARLARDKPLKGTSRIKPESLGITSSKPQPEIAIEQLKQAEKNNNTYLDKIRSKGFEIETNGQDGHQAKDKLSSNDLKSSEGDYRILLNGHKVITSKVLMPYKMVFYEGRNSFEEKNNQSRKVNKENTSYGRHTRAYFDNTQMQGSHGLRNNKLVKGLIDRNKDITNHKSENDSFRNKTVQAENDKILLRVLQKQFNSKATKTLTTARSPNLNQSIRDKQISFVSINKYIYICSAFLDNRRGRFVRLVSIVLSKLPDANIDVECSFGSTLPVIAELYKTCEDHSRPFSAFLISCAIPKTVSDSYILKHGVRVKSCDRFKCSNAQTVDIKQNENSEVAAKQDFNVCVPPLFKHIGAEKIVQFIEMTKLLGADHFTFYDYGVDKDARRVLDWYEARGEITVLPWKLPVPDMLIWYYGQSVTVWDCLLRNMHSFKYIAFNDLDEFIVSREDMTWIQMVQYIRSMLDPKSLEFIAAFRFTSYVFDDRLQDKKGLSIPIEFKPLPVLNTVWRTGIVSEIRTKLIVDPSKVFELGIHHLSKAIDKRMFSLDVQSKHATVHHYRECQTGYGMRCKNATIDTTLWRYQSKLVPNFKRVLHDSLRRY